MKEKSAQLESEVDELLRRAAEVDEEEDRRHGVDKRGDELPAELSFREGRLKKIRRRCLRWKRRLRLTRSGRRLRVISVRAFQTRGRSAISLTPNRASCPRPEVGHSFKPTTARRWWTAQTR